MLNSPEDRTRFHRWIHWRSQRQPALINHPINVPSLSILGQKLKRGNPFPAPAPGLNPKTLPPPGGPPEIPSNGSGGPNLDGSPSSNNGSPPDNGGSESSSFNNPPPENSGPGNTGSGTQSSSGSSGFHSTPITNTPDSSSTASGGSDTGSVGLPTSSSTLSYSTIGSLVSSTPDSVSVDGVGNPSTTAVTANQGIKTGPIAGIIVVVVLFLGGIVVVLLRKRNMAKRSKRRNKWLARGNTPIPNSLPSPDVLSVRSSFASPDLGNGMRSAPEFYHHDAGPKIPAQIAPPPVATVAEHVNRGIDSDTSHSNHSNHVHFTPSSAITEPPTISVRPFISSETWSFPQPPTNSPAPPRIPGDFVPDHLASVETILRSFMPSMPDELAVIPGDFVRIMKAFDDGWALIEKFESTGNSVSGLIPIDCLRPAGERLSSFVTLKRISSYGDTLGAVKLP